MTSHDGADLPPESPPEMVAVWIIDPTFPLGQLVTTPGAAAALEEAGRSPFEFIIRHGNADWGDLDEEDKQTNNDALEHDGRLLSSYQVTETFKLWIITEWDRSYTTLLLPSEY